VSCAHLQYLLDMFTNSQQIVYKDLPHPPSSYLTNFPIAAPIIPAHLVDKKSESIQAPPVEFEIEPRSEASKPLLANQLYAEYAYRSNDGSNYNVLLPNMGRAGMPYARSVPAQIATSPSALPDPGLVFDTLLKVCSFPFPSVLSVTTQV
jgi:linoleate 10R-lipoxygenase